MILGSRLSTLPGMGHLYPVVVFELRLFAFLLANRTLGPDILGQLDAAGILAEPSAFEQAMAISPTTWLPTLLAQSLEVELHAP